MANNKRNNQHGRVKPTKGKSSGNRANKYTSPDTSSTGRFPCFIKEVQKGNDFGWYNRNGNLTNVGSSYFLSNPAGKPIGKLNGNTQTDFAIPGIMVIDMLPAFAPTSLNAATSSVSGLNLAAKQLYAKMRKANAGARSQYEAPDLLLYVLSIESIYAFIASCIRAYGYLSQYPTNNRYYAKRIIEAMGFDYDDLITNRLQFFNFINTAIFRLRRFVVPAGFSSVNRSVWVNSNVFCDTTSTVKAQIYIPKYLGYWQFNATSMSTGGCLTLKYIGGQPRTVAQIEAFFNDLVAPIAQDDDFLTISGDIMKFTESYFTMEPISIDWVQDPIYDEDVMLQIHNMTNPILSNPDSPTQWESNGDYPFPSDIPFNSTYTIFQKDGLLYFQPILRCDNLDYPLTFLNVKSDRIVSEEGTLNYIDTPEDSPSVERITEATRLITIFDYAGAINPEDSLPVKTCGHEIVVGVTIYNDSQSWPVLGTCLYVDNEDADMVMDALAVLTVLSPFEWDIRRTISYLAGSGDASITHWNTRSVGTFDTQSFTKLNDIITMSLLTLV